MLCIQEEAADLLGRILAVKDLTGIDPTVKPDEPGTPDDKKTPETPVDEKTEQTSQKAEQTDKKETVSKSVKTAANMIGGLMVTLMGAAGAMMAVLKRRK